MLVLSRRLQEKIVLPTIQATIQVVAIKPGLVRLGIDAPPDVTILREEIQDLAGERLPTVSAEPVMSAGEHQLRQLVAARLRIGRVGLEILQEKLKAGLVADAEIVRAEIEDEIQMLQQRLRGETHGSVAPGQARKAGKALLVEDNANERELLATLLRGSGLDVATAGDGADALDYLRNGGQADVVLLDMGLPRCDGATVVRTVRSDPAFAGLKIFAVTGHTADEFDLGNGIDRWFLKPINPHELIHKVSEEVNGVRSRK
jgi:two-component system, OmpR family, response regulator